MDYFSAKAKHAYECYKAGKARKKVYAVVEKGDKFVVLKNKEGRKYKYCLAGGSIEENEDVVIAIKREILEELNIEAEFVRSLGTVNSQSKWNYAGNEFWVNDELQIVYTKFVKEGGNTTFGLEGEFETQDIVVEISKEEMLENVAEFVSFGIKI